MVVLLVEDNKKIATFVRQAFEYEQFTVETAVDGTEAMRKIEVNDYDLIILDLILPGTDGMEIMKQIRALGLKTPILVVTGRTENADKVAGLNAGADDYLPKPFDLAELLARARAILRRGQEYYPNELQVGELMLDTLRHEVRRNGNAIELTNKEYRILEYLMRHKGLVCSRTMLNEHVWGFNYVASNVIDVYMSRLRTKIDSGYEDKMIQTIRNTGYKLNEPKVTVVKDAAPAQLP